MSASPIYHSDNQEEEEDAIPLDTLLEYDPDLDPILLSLADDDIIGVATSTTTGNHGDDDRVQEQQQEIRVSPAADLDVTVLDFGTALSDPLDFL